MWIRKKTFQNMRKDNVAQEYNADRYRKIIASQKQLIKCLVTRIDQLKRSNPDETIGKTNQ